MGETLIHEQGGFAMESDLNLADRPVLDKTRKIVAEVFRSGEKL